LLERVVVGCDRPGIQPTPGDSLEFTCGVPDLSEGALGSNSTLGVDALMYHLVPMRCDVWFL
jgi:hypothetical protein